jgi:hypothetical protein
MYCPFDYRSNDYMWLQEEHQAQRKENEEGTLPAIS